MSTGRGCQAKNGVYDEKNGIDNSTINGNFIGCCESTYLAISLTKRLLLKTLKIQITPTKTFK